MRTRTSLHPDDARQSDAAPYACHSADAQWPLTAHAKTGRLPFSKLLGSGKSAGQLDGVRRHQSSGEKSAAPGWRRLWMTVTMKTLSWRRW
jgi:hypothetical protein